MALPHPKVLSLVKRTPGQVLFALLRASDAGHILLVTLGQRASHLLLRGGPETPVPESVLAFQITASRVPETLFWKTLPTKSRCTPDHVQCRSQELQLPPHGVGLAGPGCPTCPRDHH